MKLNTTYTRRHYGAAMTETVLVLPMILLVLSLILFFGLSMVRLQRASVMDRYEAWRQVGQFPGPAAEQPLNAVFFGQNASSIETDVDFGDFKDAQQVLIDEVSTFTDDAAAWVQIMFTQMPRVRRVSLKTTHPSSSVALWERFEGPIRHQHTIIDGDWRHASGVQFDSSLNQWTQGPPVVSFWPALRDEYFQTLDNVLEPIDENQLADVLRNLYLRTPGYGGPDLGEW